MSAAERGRGPIAVITAMKEELAALAGLRKSSTPVVLGSTGDGMRRAAQGAARLLDRHKPSAVIGAGVAGGLCSSLATGDLVVSRHVYDASGKAPDPDPQLLAQALGMLGIAAGTILSVKRPAVTAAQKAALAASIPGVDPVAVDMESAAWAREAARRGIPYLIVRTISDTALEELPGYLADCVGSDGSIRRSAVAMRALTHPASIPALIHMRQRVRECSARLAAFLEHYVALPR